MIRLLAAETVRLLSRRFTVLTLVLVFVALGAFQIFVNSELRPPTTAEVAAAQSQLAESHQDWATNHEQYEAECRAENPDATDCAYPEPTLDNFTYQQPFDEVVEISMTLAVYLSALAVFMVAGSFIGAEFSSGSMSNWLTFVPQRGRVFAAKLLVVAVFGAVVTLLGTGLALAAAVVLARVHDQTPVALGRLAGLGGRGVMVGAALAAVGFCLGLVARHTVAAVGVLLGYLFVWFVRGSLLSQSTRAQRLTPWLPEGNIAAIVEHGHPYAIPMQQVTSDGVSFDYVERTISYAHGLTYWAVLLVVVIAGSLLVFRRRDVT